MEDIEKVSEPINDSLWYVNPGVICDALSRIADTTLSELAEEVEKKRKYESDSEHYLHIGYNEALDEILALINSKKIINP